jgi:hypothetical protein
MAKMQDTSEVNAVKNAFSEIIRQVPSAIDCSKKQDLTAVLIPDGINLPLVIAAALSSTFETGKAEKID